MTFRDEERAFPGNRETLERELGKSAAQVLHLTPSGPARHRSLLELGTEQVRGIELVKAGDGPAAGAFAAQAATRAASNLAMEIAVRDGISEDLADDYARAKAEVKAILADHNAEAVRDSRTS